MLEIVIIIGGIILLSVVFFTLINNTLKQKKQLYNDLYRSVLSYCNTTTINSSIEEILKEGIEEGINADSQIVIITKMLNEVMRERDNKLYFKVSKSNIPIILSNILIIIQKYRSLHNPTLEQESNLFDIIYDCIKKPNIGLIVITRELNAI